MKKIVGSTCAVISLVLCAQFAHAQKLKVTSPAFGKNETIPSDYTCEGYESSINPEISWSGAPKKTKAFAVLVSDPDAPDGTFYHWGVYNISGKTTYLAEGASSLGGGRVAMNDFEGGQYDGPCPPDGETHRYIFKVYALSAKLKPKGGSITAAQLAQELEGKKGSFKKLVLASGSLIGTYSMQGYDDGSDEGSGDDSYDSCAGYDSPEQCSCLQGGNIWRCTTVSGETSCQCVLK